MRILSAEFVERFKVINTHPALLPNFPGAHAVRDALAAGASKTGTTVHWVDAGVDTGEIIAQQVVEIAAGDTEASLHERIKIAERGLIVEVLRELLPRVKAGR
jgi:phosphoribosylglycinamide formyltransferase-1